MHILFFILYIHIFRSEVFLFNMLFSLKEKTSHNTLSGEEER